MNIIIFILFLSGLTSQIQCTQAKTLSPQERQLIELERKKVQILDQIQMQSVGKKWIHSYKLMHMKDYQIGMFVPPYYLFNETHVLNLLTQNWNQSSVALIDIICMGYSTVVLKQSSKSIKILDIKTLNFKEYRNVNVGDNGKFVCHRNSHILVQIQGKKVSIIGSGLQITHEFQQNVQNIWILNGNRFIYALENQIGWMELTPTLKITNIMTIQNAYLVTATFKQNGNLIALTSNHTIFIYTLTGGKYWIKKQKKFQMDTKFEENQQYSIDLVNENFVIWKSGHSCIYIQNQNIRILHEEMIKFEQQCPFHTSLVKGIDIIGIIEDESALRVIYKGDDKISTFWLVLEKNQLILTNNGYIPWRMIFMAAGVILVVYLKSVCCKQKQGQVVSKNKKNLRNDQNVKRTTKPVSFNEEYIKQISNMSKIKRE